MLLYLIRHGESVYNAQRRVQGQTDVSLSDVGRRQSQAVAAALSGEDIQAVYCSPLERALETARPLATALKLEPRMDARLLEIHAGIFQGLTWDEIERAHPAEAVRWKAHEPDFVIPGGESRRALAARGRAALEDIRRENLGRVAVVAHGGVLVAAVKELLGIPLGRGVFSLLNAAITRVAWNQEVRLLTLNETDHLSRAGLIETHGGDL